VNCLSRKVVTDVSQPSTRSLPRWMSYSPGVGDLERERAKDRSRACLLEFVHKPDRRDNGGMDRLDDGRRRASALCVGREAELAALERFLGLESSDRGLVLVGDAGIGKTTLWEAGVEFG